MIVSQAMSGSNKQFDVTKLTTKDRKKKVFQTVLKQAVTGVKADKSTINATNAVRVAEKYGLDAATLKSQLNQPISYKYESEAAAMAKEMFVPTTTSSSLITTTTSTAAGHRGLIQNITLADVGSTAVTANPSPNKNNVSKTAKTIGVGAVAFNAIKDNILGAGIVSGMDSLYGKQLEKGAKKISNYSERDKNIMKVATLPTTAAVFGGTIAATVAAPIIGLVTIPTLIKTGISALKFYTA